MGTNQVEEKKKLEKTKVENSNQIKEREELAKNLQDFDKQADKYSEDMKAEKTKKK